MTQWKNVPHLKRNENSLKTKFWVELRKWELNWIYLYHGFSFSCVYWCFLNSILKVEQVVSQMNLVKIKIRLETVCMQNQILIIHSKIIYICKFCDDINNLAQLKNKIIRTKNICNNWCLSKLSYIVFVYVCTFSLTFNLSAFICICCCICCWKNCISLCMHFDLFLYAIFFFFLF